jgi:hypothetical protein
MAAKRRVRFTYEAGLVPEPVIYWLGHKFEVVTNIRMADVEEDFGWVILELDGTEDEIERALAWAREQGVRVDPITGDVVEG